MNIIIIGFGEMGKNIAQLASQKEQITIVGVVDINPKLHGKSINEFIEVKEDVTIVSEIEALADVEAEVAIITTGSEIENVAETILSAVKRNLNVITIAEEMAYPWVKNRELSLTIDSVSKQNNVSVLGTGINPGFILDTLIIVLSSVCYQVNKVKATRINDLSPFGPTVLNAQGVFRTVEAFNEGVKNGEIVGHVGFQQSVALMAEAFGWDIDEVIEEKKPIITNVDRQVKGQLIKKGMVVGCNHSVIAKSKGKILIELEHPQQVQPEAEGIKTKDEIIIEGVPNLHMTIAPEIPGGIGTVAMAVNVLPHVIKAKEGLITMRDLPGLLSIFENMTDQAK